MPIDVSVNCTDWPAAGEAGLYVNEAVRAATTVTVLLVLLEPEALVAVRRHRLRPGRRIGVGRVLQGRGRPVPEAPRPRGRRPRRGVRELDRLARRRRRRAVS